ncbi:mechanosensitive ion channel domain-containing protein [Novipirellula artificiosorum]|uniref:Mechanosensitive channel MscK n=1 Tax=Novipirellula artificiosorum TaxID=2528016 RepID=A0A5C6D5Q5_9BACT|nr:mechanosensitive ion channel domain-containing protein [Novipirellula artificiosorum]TWU32483.1 Mechanosensitive channel MscK precursor [Novipirellula artificiosorum]
MKTWTEKQLLIGTMAWVLIGLVGTTCVADGLSETKPMEASSSGPITIEQIERVLTELDQSTDLKVAIKLQAAENYRAAMRNLQSAADSDVRLKTLIAETESVSAQTDQLKKQRNELKDKKPSLDPGLSLPELEQLLPAMELQLSGFKTARQDAEVELQSRSPRRKDIRARMVVIQEKIVETTTQLKALTSTESTTESQSLAIRLLTRRLTLEKEKRALEGELAKFDAEEAADLVRLRAEVAGGNAAYTEKLITLLQQQINAAREAAAELAVRTARRETISADPALRVYAEQNQELAENAKAIAAAIAETDAKLTASTEVYESLVRQFAQTKKKVDSVGLTSSVGAMLRKQMTTLPDAANRRAAVAERQILISDTQYQLFEYEDAQQELAEIDGTIEKILADAQMAPSKNIALLESAARELMQRKREYLDELVRSTGQFFDKLIELDTIDRQVNKLEAEYANYIDQRVLWIRSGPALTAGLHIEESDGWLLSTSKWSEAFAWLVQDAKRHAFLYIMCFALIGLLLFQGRSIRKTIVLVGETAEKANCRSIAPTFRGLWLTSIVSLGWPLACVFLGWRLSLAAEESLFTVAIGQAMRVVGILWLSLDLIRQVCRYKGIGEAHFRWPTQTTAAIRRDVRLCTVLVLPIVFVTASLASSDGIHERGDIQRIAFILGMCVIGFILFRLLRPSGLLRDYFAARSSGFTQKIQYVVPLAGVSLPMSLAALAAAGYFYTAQTLVWRCFATCMFVASLVVVRSILYRMLLLRRRQLSIEQARERAAAARFASETGGEAQPVAGIVTENKQADISAHSLQSRNLVSTGMTAITLVGLWMIWIQVLPALSMIGNYPLWGNAEAAAVAGVAQPPMAPVAVANGTDTANLSTTVGNGDETPTRSVTLSDLALAMLIVFVTIVLFRNGPGLLEMSILQQLPFDASVRYAITTLVSYVIVLVGTIAACSTIGLQWSQIQWLATALTFGLAFGLQEIFANFVAGLIILLERPIRVGDIVTVDDVSGVVSRIRIRATSITNFDRKEYVVPNKEFITGRLLNWTLSDKVNRVVVEVGLAYGSDTEQARQLLLQVANDHPLVLKDPPSVATFEGFGDNSLNLVLRTFLPSLENRLQVIHDLHTAIDQSFRKAKLEIAFPQRDLHIRSVAGAAALGLEIGNQSEETCDELRDAA